MEPLCVVTVTLAQERAVYEPSAPTIRDGWLHFFVGANAISTTSDAWARDNVEIACRAVDLATQVLPKGWAINVQDCRDDVTVDEVWVLKATRRHTRAAAQASISATDMHRQTLVSVRVTLCNQK